MAKRKKISPDVVLVRTPIERALCNALVPAYFWNPDPARISYRSTDFRGKKLSAVAQRQWVKKLSKYIPRKAPVIIVGSSPTDVGALHAAYYILSEYMKTKGRDVAVLDAGQPMTYLETYPGCAVIHNVLEKATDERVQQVRDIANKFLHTFRIIVIGGSANPEKWLVNRAAIYPDIVLRVKDLTPEELRNDG